VVVVETPVLVVLVGEVQEEARQQQELQTQVEVGVVKMGLEMAQQAVPA
jgi:hypothetical protein